MLVTVPAHDAMFQALRLAIKLESVSFMWPVSRWAPTGFLRCEMDDRTSIAFKRVRVKP